MSVGRKIYTNGARDIVHLQTKPGLQLQAHDRQQADARGLMLADLVKILTHGAEPDGETSTGYPRMRALSPEEIVDRAASIVEAAWATVKVKGWYVDTAPAADLFDAQDNASEPAGFR